MAGLTQQVPRHTVAILGGGIAGLSTAYYINRKFGPSVRPIIFEATGRSGGWMQSFKADGSLFEVGPRTIRPAGVPGLNALDLIEELELDEGVTYIPPHHPSAKNRLIYLDKKLVRLPTEPNILWKKVDPFDRPLYFTLLKELLIPRKRVEDDSLHGFVARRFGQRIADTMIDPLVRGVCAGDARKISAKFIIGPGPLSIEQKYGSVVGGALMMSLLRRKHPDPYADIPNVENIGKSALAQTAKEQNWSVWTLETGLETLPQKLEEKVVESGTEILKNSPVKSIHFGERNQIEYVDTKTNSIKTMECSHIISAVPSSSLTSIIESARPSHPDLSRILKTIQPTDVTVTNLKFSNKILDKEAFGFLVPSLEKDVEGLLGVVFNTCAFPQGEDTILTVMSQGIDIDTIVKHVRTILNMGDPSFVDVKPLQGCIPQYTVGHYERVKKIREYIEAAKLPLTLVGASYDGVSVNDCILSGLRASEKLPLDIDNPSSSS